MGININDCTQDFTGQILRGEKTIETRSTRSLDPYIGERVGIVRTGVGKAALVGYATVGEPVVYDSVAKFRRDYDKHLVAPGSAFDMKDRLKYGYPLMQVESVEPRVIESRGIVARKVNPMTSDSEYLDAVSRGDMKTAQRLVDEAAKKAGVINAGKPLYHGGNRTKTSFAAGATRSGMGLAYLTDNKRAAWKYALGGGVNSEMSLADYRRQQLKKLPSREPTVQKLYVVGDDADFSGYQDKPSASQLIEMFGEGKMSRILEEYSSQYRDELDRGESVESTLQNALDEGGFVQEDTDATAKVPELQFLAGSGLLDSYLKKIGKNVVAYDDAEAGGKTYVVFEPSQIKSADPVTYDDAGNVIPLSQRFNDQSDDIRNPYTRPDLRERLKRKIMAGSKGGNPGQWSARKAQLLAAEYEKAGGGYTGGRSKAQRSLSKWTKQDWRTKSGKPSLETGERYLPAAAIKKLSSAEYAATSRAKREATGQFSKQPRRIAEKTKRYRNPMDPDITNPKDPRSAMTQIATTVNTYRKASKMLGGRVLDYGAGYGLGTDAMREEGLLADSFEPFPEEWKGKRPPVYTDSADIPSESYDSLVSFSVVNVVDPDERKLLFKEVARILRPDGFALITGRTRQDVSAAKIKTPHLEEGGYLIGVGEEQRYQKGFTQAELERYAKEVLGPGFTVEANRALNGASIKITKGKTNPAKRDTVRSKLSRIIEPGDRILCYDTASGEDFYRLWDVIHTAMPMTKEALVEVEGMLDDDGVLVIESGESPAGLQDHFRKATRYQGLLLVQGPKNPEQARIETEKLRRELE